jgi:membrane-bound lytic murein transglycosylase A
MQMAFGISRPTANAWRLIGLAAGAFLVSHALHQEQPRSVAAVVKGDPSPFGLLPGWLQDDHASAFAAFHKVCAQVRKRSRPSAVSSAEQALQSICKDALARPARISQAEARRFFEARFTPYRIRTPGRTLLTGYFEPELDGSLSGSRRFPIPVYARPPDLVKLRRQASALGLPHFLTAARRTPFGYEPYYTRRQIEQGALRGQSLELVYLRRRIDAYVMQTQGSGLIRLREGGRVRLGFAAKNGYPYTSIARRTTRRGEVVREETPLERLFNWIGGAASKKPSLAWENQSYVFFRRLPQDQAKLGPHGAFGTALTPGRSLAIDPRYHRYGLPIWVHAPQLTDDRGARFARLMVAEDTGSAIRGPVRGDVFWGTGAKAGAIAWRTKHKCAFYVLWPRVSAQADSGVGKDTLRADNGHGAGS